ncbi:MAG: helix-turn-helix transcriptional regulator [Peptococcaceae bacterium]|nr:helix-turn-helix transcriptional regulator [Peptococcaceae bacterium]
MVDKKKTAVLFGQRLKALRLKANMTQKELGELIGIQHFKINQYEHGNKGFLPRTDNISKVANFFGVPEGWLTSDTDDSVDFNSQLPDRITEIKGHILTAVKLAEVDDTLSSFLVEQIMYTIELFKKQGDIFKKN